MTSPKYWVVPVKKGRKILSIEVITHDGENATVVRRYPIGPFQDKETALMKAEYDKAYFEAQGHHRTWADSL
jgi:hypothetical protein